jgi:hypothetical protein
VAKDFTVRLRCPYGDQDQLLVLQDREEALTQILETPLDFDCPVHGVQREIPVEASETELSPASRRRRKESTAAIRLARRPRSSKRLSLHLPVLIFGWSKDEISFHENTSTLLVNASGGLVALTTRVSLGGTIFIVNKATQEEQECRVAYVGPELKGKTSVGIAFKYPVASFWRVDRQKRRPSEAFRAQVRGSDHNGHAFAQGAHAVGGPFSNLLPMARKVWGFAPVLVIAGVILWVVMRPVRTPRQASSPQPAELQQPARPPKEPSGSVGLPTVQELGKPWSSKTFDFRTRLTGENIPSIVIRLPSGAPDQPRAYWAFSLQEPLGRCQLEYITDLRKLSADYGYEANHPMVGNPCSRAIFDPLQMTEALGGAWIRGAIVKGYGVRPPLGIKIRIERNQLVPVEME